MPVKLINLPMLRVQQRFRRASDPEDGSQRLEEENSAREQAEAADYHTADEDISEV